MEEESDEKKAAVEDLDIEELGKGVEDESEGKRKSKRRSFIAALDIGTSFVRCVVFGKKGQPIGSSKQPMGYLETENEQQVEQDPIELWEKCVQVLQDALVKGSLKAADLLCVSISCQRASFVMWNAKDGKPISNLNSWQDVQTADYVIKLNKTARVRILRFIGKVTCPIIRIPLLQGIANFEFTTSHANVRSSWFLKQSAEAQALHAKGNLRFGTVDTWLLWKLTGGKVHATDYTNISATGFFDPFAHKLGKTFLPTLGLQDTSFLPEIFPSDHVFGHLEETILGVRVPLCGIVGDQMAALAGQACFDRGECKLTCGTGCFVSVVTGKEALVSHGLFPLVAWSLGNEMAYELEAISDMHGVMEWGCQMGFYDRIEDTSDIAQSVPDTQGVVFVPAMTGLRHPHWDATARSALLGVTSSTTRAHVTRAILEGMALLCCEMFLQVGKDSGIQVAQLWIDGGVSNNDFFCQCVADFFHCKVLRPEHNDIVAARGAAIIGGLGMGLWKSREEVKELARNVDTFEPKISDEERTMAMTRWNRAVQSVLGWARPL